MSIFVGKLLMSNHSRGWRRSDEGNHKPPVGSQIFRSDYRCNSS